MSDMKTNDMKAKIDEIGGAGSSDKIEGKTNEMVGKAKQAVGEQKNDKKLIAEGKAQEAEGVLGHMIGNVKEYAETAIDAAKEGAHNVADKVKDIFDGDDEDPKASRK